uniref:Profilin n=1 Tax=Macrostomum lignano TaxID=282301 RepID=A0A1I8JCG9_9PLAT
MSWDSILHSMLQSDCINRAALAGRDGLIWSATPDFQPTQQEILNLVNYCEGESASPASFTLAGRRYLTLRRLEGCIDVALTLNCVVVGAYVAPAETPLTAPPAQHKQSNSLQQCQQQPNRSEKVHQTVMNVRLYLRENGF